MVKRARPATSACAASSTTTSARCWRALDTAGLADSTRVVYTSDHGDNLGARGLWGKSTMYEESAGVPLIVAGPGFAPGKRIATPASLLDLYPFIMETAGEASPRDCHAGASRHLARAAGAGEAAARATFSEYHGMGSKTAAYMMRKGPWKLVHYADYAPQLFDLASDPEELNDLAARRQRHARCWKSCRPSWPASAIRPRSAAAPRPISRSCSPRWAARQFVIKRGDLGFSPPPGVAPAIQLKTTTRAYREDFKCCRVSLQHLRA